MRLRNAMALSTASSIAMPTAAVVTGPLLARALGPDGRGAVAAALSPALLAVSVANVGIPAAVLYFLSKGYSTKSTMKAAFPIILGVGTVAAVALVMLEPYVLQEYSSVRTLYIGVSLTIPIALVVATLQTASVGLGSYLLPVIERIISVLVRLVLLVTFFVLGALTVNTAGWISWMPGIAVVVVYLGLWRHRGSGAGLSTVPRSKLLRYSLSAWSGSIAGILILRLDQVLMIGLTSADQLGYYVVAVAVAEVPLVAIGALKDVVTSAAAARGETNLIPRVLRIVILIGVPATISISLISPILIPLLFGDDFGPAIAMTQILLAGSFLSSIGVIAGAGLAALGRPGLFSISQISGLLISAGLLFLLTPIYGGIGAAVASVVAYGITSLIALIAFRLKSGVTLYDLVVPSLDDVKDLRFIARIRRS